jgi:hypothetical protein
MLTLTKHAQDADRHGQAGAGGALGSYHPIERIECFRNELAELRERWDNRLVLERASLAEIYANGRLEILLYGNWNIGRNDVLWAVRVSADTTIGELVGSDGPGPDDASQSNRWDKQVMFVVIVQDMEGPERVVRSVLRPYVFEKKVFSVGEGLLYRVEDGGGFKVFPVFTHREMWLRLRIDSSNDAGAHVIQCSSQVMDRISNDERKCLGHRFGGTIDDLIRGRLCVGRHNVRFDREGIKDWWTMV